MFKLQARRKSGKAFTVRPLTVALTGLSLALAGISPSGFGAEQTGMSESVEDVEELQNLLAILEQQTEIATKTKLNADFVPGIVTVLHGDELEARGIRTVWEALGLVPGMEPAIGRVGGQRIVVRGLGGVFASGNIKIMLNNVSMNSALSALADPVLYMPVEQVERIEVIRGPGSAIHGEFAYQGVVNVITRHKGNRVYGATGSYQTFTGGGVFSWDKPEKDLKVSLNIAGWESDGADSITGPDALYGTLISQADISNAPGPANEDVGYQSALLSMDYRNFSLTAQIVDSSHGDFFGTINVLPGPADRDAYANKYRTLEMRQRFGDRDTLATEVHLGWLEYENTFDFDLLPPGYDFWFTNTGLPIPVELPDGYQTTGYYTERKLYGGTDFSWHIGERQDWLLGFSFARIHVGDAWQANNIDPVTLEPLPAQEVFTFDDGVSWVDPDKDRRVNSVTLQDEFRVSEAVTVTAGLRYDNYDDVGENMSPRLAAVYRIDHHHILKAQYAEAFRPPTFFETVWTPDIDPETISTYELGYIYRGTGRVGRATVFYSELEDLIVAQDILGFTNLPGARVQGLELELEQRLGSTLKLDGELTLVDTEDRVTGEEIAGAAHLTGAAGLVYQPRSDRMLTLQYRYVGEREREVGDVRENLAGYHTLDVSGSLLNLWGKGLSLRAGVKNIFDEDVRDPAPLTQDVTGKVFPSYPGDYPRPGRQWWLQVSYAY